MSNNPIDDRQPDAALNSEAGVAPQGELGPSAQFQCEICGQVFTNQADLSEHVMTHEQGKKETSAGVA